MQSRTDFLYMTFSHILDSLGGVHILQWLKFKSAKNSKEIIKLLDRDVLLKLVRYLKANLKKFDMAEDYL